MQITHQKISQILDWKMSSVEYDELKSNIYNLVREINNCYGKIYLALGNSVPSLKYFVSNNIPSSKMNSYINKEYLSQSKIVLEDLDGLKFSELSYLHSLLFTIYTHYRSIILPNYNKDELKEGALSPLIDEYSTTIQPLIFSTQDAIFIAKDSMSLPINKVYYRIIIRVDNDTKSHLDFNEFIEPILNNLKFYNLGYLKIKNDLLRAKSFGDKYTFKVILIYDLPGKSINEDNSHIEKFKKEEIGVLKMKIVSLAEKINTRYAKARSYLDDELPKLEYFVHDRPIHYGALKSDKISISEFDLSYMDTFSYCDYIIESLTKIFDNLNKIILPKYSKEELELGALAPICDEYETIIYPKIFDKKDYFRHEISKLLPDDMVYYSVTIIIKNDPESEKEYESFIKPILANLEYYNLKYIPLKSHVTNKGVTDFQNPIYIYKNKRFILYDDNEVIERVNIIKNWKQFNESKNVLISEAKNEYNTLLLNKGFSEYGNVRYLTIELLSNVTKFLGSFYIEHDGFINDELKVPLEAIKLATKQLKEIEPTLTNEMVSDIKAHLEDYEIVINRYFYYRKFNIKMDGMGDRTQYYQINIKLQNNLEVEDADIEFEKFIEILEYSFGFKIWDKGIIPGPRKQYYVIFF